MQYPEELEFNCIKHMYAEVHSYHGDIYEYNIYTIVGKTDEEIRSKFSNTFKSFNIDEVYNSLEKFNFSRDHSLYLLKHSIHNDTLILLPNGTKIKEEMSDVVDIKVTDEYYKLSDNIKIFAQKGDIGYKITQETHYKKITIIENDKEILNLTCDYSHLYRILFINTEPIIKISINIV